MANVDFVIGAKDNASPAIANVAKGLSGLSSAAKVAMAAGAGVAAMFAAVASARSASAAYDEQSASIGRLANALRLQGIESQAQVDHMQAYATGLQKITGIADESILAIMDQATRLGIHTSQVGEATKSAIGLAEATGRSMDESLGMVTSAIQGNFSAFADLLPQIQYMRTEEERLAAVMSLASAGLQQKAEASETAAGMSQRAANAVQDLMSAVGTLIAPVRILISTGIEALAESLRSILTPAVERAQSLLERMGPIMDWVREAVVGAINRMITAFTFLETVVTNLDKIWLAMVASAELQLIRLAEFVKHTLTEVIPAYAQWFGRNWQQLLYEAMAGAYMIVSDAIQRIIDSFKALWEFIVSWGDSDIMGSLGEIAGRSWLDGFHSQLEQMPDVASRALTEREKQLQSVIGGVAQSLGDEFNRKLEGRLLDPGKPLGKLSLDDQITTQVNLSIQRGLGGIMGAAGGGGGMQAQQSRLLTRGPANRRDEMLAKMQSTLATIAQASKASSDAAQATVQATEAIRDNTSRSMQLVPTS